ncbi:MAG: helix-turn-helix transcriptional regulator [Leptothrix sp. (in: b-proteobacteria)]
MTTSTSSFAILRRANVMSQTGYSRSTIYLRIAQGLFPKPVLLGPRAVGWPASEVAALNAARIAGLSDEQIRALVLKLQAARQTVNPASE